MNMSESVKNLATALIAVQKALPKVGKDKENPFFHSRYAGLDTVMPLALKALTEQGLGVSQTVGRADDGASTLTTILLHESGEWISDTQPLLLVKADPQGQGSAITYARRYGLMAMLGLVAEDDDDGAAASNGRTEAPPRPAAPKKAATSYGKNSPGRVWALVFEKFPKGAEGSKEASERFFRTHIPHLVDGKGFVRMDAATPGEIDALIAALEGSEQPVLAGDDNEPEREYEG